jgi:serine/threonine protein kinase/tetratricopeptide (TPR) repeat protein
MGSVYQAEDFELDRPVALKLIRPELAASQEILQRFKQELILAREVTHENVVRIFDLGVADGIKFITMEYVEGEDLSSILEERGKLPERDVASITAQVCRALIAAHAAGVVHRDLKPQNVMVDDKGRAKVMDFGVAHSMDLTGMTRTGEMIGTPAYMSPEQAKGERVDARSDLFSLGVIIYEMLVGKLPYEAETPMGTLIKRTQESAVPPVKVDSSVPAYLNNVCVRCLEIETDLRYQSAAEVLEDLESQHGPRAHSTIARLPYTLRRSARSTRWMAAIFTIAAISLGALAVTGRLSFGPSTAAPGAVAGEPELEPLGLAIMPFRNASGNPDLDWLGSSLAEMLRSDVGQSSELRTVPTDRVHQIMSDLKVTSDSPFDPATLERLGTFSNAGMVVTGEYLKLGESIRIDASLYDLEQKTNVALGVEAPDEEGILAAIDELASAIRENMDLSANALGALEATSFTPSSASITALRNYNEGLQLERQGNYAGAQQRFQAAVEEDPEFALAFSKLGQTFSLLGYDDEAENASRTAVELSADLDAYERYLISAEHASIMNDYEQAIESYEALYATVPEDIEVNFNLARLYEDTLEFDFAREHLERVLRYDPNYVDALYALGRVEIRAGNPQEAITPLNQALALTIQLENQEGRGRVLNAIGIAYKRMNNLDEALRIYTEALEIRRQLDQKSGIAASLSEIGEIQYMLGDLDEALDSYDEALAIRQEIGDRAGVGGSLIDLGNLALDRGQSEEALEYYKDSLQIQREIGNQRDEALCLNNIGAVYLEGGEFADALTYFEQALRLREQWEVPYEIGEAHHNLAETTALLGQYDRALDHYLQALEQWRAVGDAVGESAAAHGIGNILAYQGRFGAALESHREALDSIEESGEGGYWLLMARSGYGDALAQVGRFDEGRQVLDEASQLAEDLENEALLAHVASLEGNSFLFEGNSVAAAERYELASRQAESAGDRRELLTARLGLATVGVIEGHYDDAIETLRSSIDEAADLGLRYTAAEATLHLAEALLKSGDTEGARREADSALRTCERLDLRLLLATSYWVLGKADQAAGDEQGMARNFTQVSRLLEEIRNEAGEGDPFLRQDLQNLASAVSE